MTPLENELSNLIGRACSEFGICLSSAASKPIETRRSITDAEFACAVLTAERLTPPEHSEFYKPLKHLFREHFGRASMKIEDYDPKRRPRYF